MVADAEEWMDSLTSGPGQCLTDVVGSDNHVAFGWKPLRKQLTYEPKQWRPSADWGRQQATHWNVTGRHEHGRLSQNGGTTGLLIGLFGFGLFLKLPWEGRIAYSWRAQDLRQ